MDGVLADFEKHHVDVFGYACSWTGPDNWKATPDFFVHMPPMPDMEELLTATEGHDPIVLTGLPRTNSGRAWQQKRDWLDKYVGADMPMIGCRSKHKNRYSRPGDIIIDDREEFASLWRGVGGIWITHTSARSSIETLEGLLNGEV